jgi:hypothetical protein
MPTPLVPSAARVTVSGTLFGQLVENVWHVTTVAGPPLSDLEDIAGIFQLMYANLVIPFADALFINSVTVRYLGDVGGPEFSLINTPAQQGGDANGSMPGNVALCISLRTALAGRRFRGRKFFSGIPVPEVADNTISSTFADAVVASISGSMGDLTAAGFPLSVLSYVGPTIVPVTSVLYTDLFVDSQRRRLTGRGR